MRALINILFLLAAVALIVANPALRPDAARLNYEFLPQMAHAPRYNAFAPNANFADGKTLQAPPAGAIARGYLPLHYVATPQDALRAGEELHSPVDLNSQQARERGAMVFTNYCAVCHGPSGTGNGTITQRGFPPPPSLLLEHALKMKEGQMFHVLAFGQNNMPSYASQLSRMDRWYAIAYVRALQAQAPAPPAVTKAADAKSPSAATPGGQP